jgi:hypothetical protein
MRWLIDSHRFVGRGRIHFILVRIETDRHYACICFQARYPRPRHLLKPGSVTGSCSRVPGVLSFGRAEKDEGADGFFVCQYLCVLWRTLL